MTPWNLPGSILRAGLTTSERTRREMTANIDSGVQATADRYKDYWKDRNDMYWYWRLVQEVVELGFVLLGWHHDTPEHERVQIASMMINWNRRDK